MLPHRLRRGEAPGTVAAVGRGGGPAGQRIHARGHGLVHLLQLHRTEIFRIQEGLKHYADTLRGGTLL